MNKNLRKDKKKVSKKIDIYNLEIDNPKWRGYKYTITQTKTINIKIKIMYTKIAM